MTIKIVGDNFYMNRIAQRILKQVAVYVPGIGNTIRSGDWLRATRPKNDLPYQTPEEEYKAIQQYIREYEQEIAELKKQLESDPNNQELLRQLKDKQRRKQMFEEDINMPISQEVIDEDERRKKEKEREKEEIERRLTQRQTQRRLDSQSKNEEQKSRNEHMLSQLPEYLQELVSDVKNYKPHVHKGYISSSKQEFKQKLYTTYCKYLKGKVDKYLTANKCSKSGEYGLKFQKIVNDFIQQLPVNIVNKFIDRFYIVDSGKSLLYYLQDTDSIDTTVIPALLGSIQYTLRNVGKSTNFFSTSNIRAIITKKIIMMWNANKFGMIARKTHDGTKYYIPIQMPVEQLNVVVEYLINETNIVEKAKQLFNK